MRFDLKGIIQLGWDLIQLQLHLMLSGLTLIAIFLLLYISFDRGQNSHMHFELFQE